MPPSEVEKLFRVFAEERKAELPRFTPDGIPITLENKFDDAIYNYLYAYWKEQSGEYDPKKDVIPESEMNKMHPKTKNEKKFEQWLLQQYGMTNKEQREHTLKGNLESLWEIFSAADMVLLVKAFPNIGKNLAKLGKNVGDDVAEEAIEKTVKKEAAEEMAESTAKKEVTDTAEDLSQKTIDKDNALEDSKAIAEGNKTGTWAMTEGRGVINGREYSQHAMERMAPDTPQVRAELSRRAEKAAEQLGYKVGSKEYYDFCKKYVDPRNIPPSVIEDAISSTKAIAGNKPDIFIHETVDVKVIVNSSGKVVTVIPK